MLGVAVSLLYGMPLPISEHFSNITTPIGVLDPTNAASVYTAVGPPPIMAMFFTLCAPELLKGERRSAELVARAHQRNPVTKTLQAARWCVSSRTFAQGPPPRQPMSFMEREVRALRCP